LESIVLSRELYINDASWRKESHPRLDAARRWCFVDLASIAFTSESTSNFVFSDRSISLTADTDEIELLRGAKAVAAGAS
jgi:hypothetical protein